MTTEQQRVKDWMKKAGQECPEKPTMPSLEIRKLRARLILEEALETIIDGLGVMPLTEGGTSALSIEDVAFDEGICKPSLVELADGMADLQYVNLGTAVACGIDLEPVFAEVCRSNDSKWWRSDELDSPSWQEGWSFERLENGYFCVTDQGGKIRKPPGYSPANIAPIITNMGDGRDTIRDIQIRCKGCGHIGAGRSINGTCLVHHLCPGCNEVRAFEPVLSVTPFVEGK